MKKYRRILSAVYGEVWGILPEKLEAIIEMLELRSEGRMFSDEEIKARISQQFRVEESQKIQTPGIAVLNLHGTISQRMNWMMEFSGGTSTEMFGKAFDKAIADDSVKRILIDARTPGGSVTGVEELATKIFNARGKKPITTFVSGDLLASAGYWIGTAADEVVATPSATGIGSIGVIQVHQYAKTEGLTVLRTVPNKADMNGYEKLTESATKNVMSKMMSIHNVFEAAVAKHRGVDVKEVKADYGQGSTFASREALAAGMIDRIATLEELLSEWGAAPQIDDDVTYDVVPVVSVSEKVTDMKLTPKIQLALVRAQLVKAGADAKEFQAALDLHCAAHGVAETATEDAVLASFLAQSPAPHTAPEKPAHTTSDLRESISTGDVSAVIRLAGNIEEGDRFGLLNEVMDRISAGEIGTMKDVRDYVGKKKADASTVAGATAGDIKMGKAESDKLVDQIVASITMNEYASTDRSKLNIETSEGPRPIVQADVSRDARMKSPIGIARLILGSNPLAASKANQLSNEQVARIVCGAPLSDFGIGAYSDGPAFNTTGLFRAVLNNAKNTVARKEYAETPVHFPMWASRGRSIANFDKHTIKALGSLTDPRAVPENGEFEEQTVLGTEAEAVRLHVWGGIFSNTFQMMLSDDLGFFAGVEKKMVRKLRRKQDILVTGVLRDNPFMGDGKTLFHTDHNNIVDVAAVADLFTEATIAAARVKLLRQTPIGSTENPDLDEEGDPIGLMPYAGLIPPELSEKASVYFNSTSQAGQSNPNVKNPHLSLMDRGGIMQLVRLTDVTKWFMTADPADVEFISYHYLENNDAPRIDVAESFTSLAYKTRVWVPFGTSAKDFRGAVEIAVTPTQSP